MLRLFAAVFAVTFVIGLPVTLLLNHTSDAVTQKLIGCKVVAGKCLTS